MRRRIVRRLLAAALPLVAALGVAAAQVQAHAQAPGPGAPPPRRSPPRSSRVAMPTTLAGVYSDSQALRGQELYLGLCKQCHTPESHTGAVFRQWWSGRQLGELFSFVSIRMPKNEPGSLDPQHYADLVAYLLKMNAMPAGPSELPSDVAALQKIRIVTPPATARPRKKS